MSSAMQQSVISTTADAVGKLLQFGAAMLGAGNTATRTRQSMEAIAQKLDLDAVSVSISFDSITATVRRSDEWITRVRDIRPAAINVWKVAELERLPRSLKPETALGDIEAKLAVIQLTESQYSNLQIGVAVALATAGFAFVNGAAAPEMIASAFGGGFGQWARMWLSRRRFNQFGAAALSGAIASGVFVIAATLAGRAGFEFAQYPAGFIASVLFLVPGFPLIAGLFDLLQYQTVAAVSRFAFGLMILLSVALGLSFVIEAAKIDISRQPPLELVYSLKLLLRGVASFVAGCAFAMAFNSPLRIALSAGLLALVANSLRLVLIDIGVMLAPAAFCAALVIGLVAIFADHRFKVPPIAMTVAPVVIMMPGAYAFEAIVLFNHGQMVDAVQASASCWFVIGALAMGLATSRFFRPITPLRISLKPDNRFYYGRLQEKSG
jgi:uncharacterized membrane protein YjjP (DUF1212 family)